MSRRKQPPPPALDPAEAALFREAVGPVREIVHRRPVPDLPRPPPSPRFREQDEQAVLRDMLSDAFDPADLETGEELVFARPGLQHRLLKKLRRGHFAIRAECDLHGLTVPEARQALARFLDEARGTGQRCVRIIHGKGLGSRQRIPVLKHKVNKWLRQRDEVLAFCTARPVDGGTGAVYVLLKASK